jgi:hypothetical protein
MGDVNLPIPIDSLRPLVKGVVAEVLAELTQKFSNDGRLAYTEAEAAGLLGLTARQLAEQRRAGRLGYSRGPKDRALYSKSDLLAYLASNREEPRS